MILFMIAGYETSSTALTYCTYMLAKYPEEQLKLFNEIDSHFNQDQKVISIKKFNQKFAKYLQFLFYKKGNN